VKLNFSLEIALGLLIVAGGCVFAHAQMAAQRTTPKAPRTPAVGAGALSNSYPKPQINAEQGIGAFEPDFYLQDQNGNNFDLQKQRGHWVLLFFYRGYWSGECMAEMRDLAAHTADLAKLDVELVAISVDNQQHAHDVWEGAAQKKVTILSDPDLAVIRRWGLLHAGGHDGKDIALRATVFVGQNGREQWRRVSRSAVDIPSWNETLAQIKKAQSIPQQAAPAKL
jgi:peroxiredoxin